MKNIFNTTMELSGLVTKMAGACDIISIDVNSAMKQLKESERLIENEKVKNKFFADRYFELVDDLVKYGIVQKEWDSE